MNSKFDCTVLELLFINLGVVALTFFTLGLAFPWALSMKLKFITSRTIVDGQRLDFDGTGGQLFGTWIKLFLLTIVTLGIYALWTEIEIQRWVARHTHFAGRTG